MTSWFRRLAETLGIGTVAPSSVDSRLNAQEARIDRLDVRVRALEADVAARIAHIEEGDSADTADKPDAYR